MCKVRPIWVKTLNSQLRFPRRIFWATRHKSAKWARSAQAAGRTREKCGHSTTLRQRPQRSPSTRSL